MTDKEKEAIERLKYIDMQYDCNNYYSRYDLDCIETILNLLQTQQAEIEKSRNTKDLYYENKELRKLLEKKDEIIVLILKELYKKAHISTKCYLQKSIKECLKHKNCIECLKQYFERKVETEEK